jgi:hypothetical protein
LTAPSLVCNAAATSVENPAEKLQTRTNDNIAATEIVMALCRRL